MGQDLISICLRLAATSDSVCVFCIEVYCYLQGNNQSVRLFLGQNFISLYHIHDSIETFHVQFLLFTAQLIFIS